jgi:hypothetical protein
MFGVMLILPIPCLFVLLRIAVRSENLKEQVGTWNLESQASCAIDHLFLPNNVLINHNNLHKLSENLEEQVWLSLYLVYH